MALAMVFMMSSTIAFASEKEKKADSDKSATPAETEITLSEEEITGLTNRVEEIREMDKSDLLLKDKRELNKELREIKKNVERAGGTVYIGGASLILLIILIILLV